MERDKYFSYVTNLFEKCKAGIGNKKSDFPDKNYSLENHVLWFIEKTQDLMNVIYCIHKSNYNNLNIYIEVSVTELNIHLYLERCLTCGEANEIYEEWLEMLKYIGINPFLYSSSCRYFLYSDFRFIDPRIEDLVNKINFEISSREI